MTGRNPAVGPSGEGPQWAVRDGRCRTSRSGFYAEFWFRLNRELCLLVGCSGTLFMLHSFVSAMEH